jgi:hypothetical protein
MSAQANPMSAVTMRRVQRARPQRNHRMLAQCLRRTAKRTEPRHPLARQRETLLHDRVAAVRDDLRCIAAMLEHAPGIDPQCIAEIRDLLSTAAIARSTTSRSISPSCARRCTTSTHGSRSERLRSTPTAADGQPAVSARATAPLLDRPRAPGWRSDRREVQRGSPDPPRPSRPGGSAFVGPEVWPRTSAPSETR